jgi:hypothetical protein
MKKAIFCMIAIAIVGLLITSVSSVPVQKTNDQTLSLTVAALDLEPQKLSVPTQYVTETPTKINKMPILGDPAFEGDLNQLHPAIGLTGQLQMVAYYEEQLGNIIWDYSSTGGPPYSGGVYYDNGGDYPSIKYWGQDSNSDDNFYGTFVTDYMDLSGAPTYLFHTIDATDPQVYEMTYWDWSGYGWHDMKDADISCDNSQEEWEWGISCYVTSTTYGDTYTDGPTVTYADSDEQGSGIISWYYVDGCAHCDVSIDNSIIYSHAVYDWYDPDAEYWKLLVRVQDFDDILAGYDQLFDLDTGGNTEYPAIAAENGNIVIVAQTDVNGNADIICLYGSTISSLSTTYVVDSGEDEMYPDVRHVSGDTFLCTYYKGDALYGKITDDAGATWGAEVMLSDPAEVVEDEYKFSDLSESALKAMYQIDNGLDIDIYITDVLTNDPPSDPTISGPNVGSPNKDFDFQFTATDSDGDQVKFKINWGDGQEETTALTPSGSPITATHQWAEKGSYVITASAVDEKGAESGTATHDITIPRSKSVNNLVLRILERFPLLSQLLGL